MVNRAAQVREGFEALEDQWLHPMATQSAKSTGREIPEEPCPIRTCYQRDRDRILHSKAFRRLKHKTQVFIAPVGDHFRTRMTHSLAVSQVSRTIARALKLNEDLTESIALGHDLGHPPFGHAGESILNDIFPDGFHHQKQSIRIVRDIEKLNLTREVLDGIAGGIGGSISGNLNTLEAQVVDTADRMAYLHHDVEDARRAGLMEEEDLPRDIKNTLGFGRDERLNRMVMDMVAASLQSMESSLSEGGPKITMSREITEAMFALRQWMFEHVYLKQENIAQTDKVRRVITGLYEYFIVHPDDVSENIPVDHAAGDLLLERRAMDYIAGMTDRFAIDLYKKLLLPNPYSRRSEDLGAEANFL